MTVSEWNSNRHINGMLTGQKESVYKIATLPRQGLAEASSLVHMLSLTTQLKNAVVHTCLTFLSISVNIVVEVG
jgi:hypothetical protein